MTCSCVSAVCPAARKPTNHLDIDSKEVFEDALLEFPGTAIIVSHDRYFLQKIPTRILELTHDGFNEYLGKYDYYLEKKESLGSGKQYLADLGSENAARGGGGDAQSTAPLDASQQRLLNKQKEAEERRRQRQSEKLEAEIERLETKIAEVESQMNDEKNAADYNAMQELSCEHETLSEALETAFEQWSALQES